MPTHMRQGFDNEKYIELQAANIRRRIAQFGGKLYLEFGGKLFDDHHASRVLPGFEPDAKFRMLSSLVDDVEIVIAVNASHIEQAKVRGDLGITYDEDAPSYEYRVKFRDVCGSKARETKAYEGTSSLPQRS